MVEVVIGIVGVLIVAALMDIITQLKRVNNLKEEELELLKNNTSYD
jgi:hypothetical protein